MSGSRTLDRGVSAVLGAVVILAVVVTLAASTGLYATQTVEDVRSDPPPASVIVTDYHDAPGSEDDWVRFTYEGGAAIPADQLAIRSTKPVDIDGDRNFAESGLSRRESFVEKPPGGDIQVDIGETWNAGETVYVGGNGDLSGETVWVVWSSTVVKGQNPGTVDGPETRVIREQTLGE